MKPTHGGPYDRHMAAAMSSGDRFWYAAGALTVAVVGVELAHRYWFPLLDSAWRSAETLARRFAA